jgi:hypothetical protein
VERAAVLRQLERWMLTYEEKGERIVVRDGGRWMSLLLEDGQWRYVTAKGQGTFRDDASLERALERAFPE